MRRNPEAAEKLPGTVQTQAEAPAPPQPLKEFFTSLFQPAPQPDPLPRNAFYSRLTAFIRGYIPDQKRYA
jgi:hypothetical protein